MPGIPKIPESIRNSAVFRSVPWGQGEGIPRDFGRLLQIPAIDIGPRGGGAKDRQLFGPPPPDASEVENA